MAPTHLQHRRTHNLLLVSKLLNQRDAASPFTLVLDSLEQSAKPLIAEYIRRAKTANVHIIFISFETLRKPRNVETFIPAWSQSLQAWQTEVTNTIKAQPTTQKTLLILDSLTPLSTTNPQNLPNLLSSLLSPRTSLLAIYHPDIPLPPSPPNQTNPYTPHTLTLLKYLATTLFTLHPPHHVLAHQAARARSLIEPSFGLHESVEGLVQGLGCNSAEGVVLEMEHRRKSGRGVREMYYLPLKTARRGGGKASAGAGGEVMLLEDYPPYRALTRSETGGEEGGKGGGGDGTTFELGLTERQRRDRENVVLPYYDAQRGDGVGEGGRILYDMGSEDDFDEEEDEI